MPVEQSDPGDFMRALMALMLMTGCGDPSTKDSTNTTDDDTAALPTNPNTSATPTTSLTGSTPSPTVTAFCDPMAKAGGTSVTLSPSDGAGAIQDALDAASEGETVLLEDGVYDLDTHTLTLRRAGVTLRSVSGDPSLVTLDANLGSTVAVAIEASDVTLAEISILDPFFEGVVVAPRDDDAQHLTGVSIYRVHVVDPGRSGVSVQADVSGQWFADDGEIACSRVELTPEGRDRFPSTCLVGGIQISRAQGWTLRDNHLEDLWCNAAAAAPAIAALGGSRDTVIERNLIEDCGTGLQIGLSDATVARGYDDVECNEKALVQHVGGILRNNLIVATSTSLHLSDTGFDVGIALVGTCDVTVIHTSIFSTEDPLRSAIWLEGISTTGVVANTLSSHGLIRRDDAPLEVDHILEDADAGLFVYPPGGDLHLSPGAARGVDEGSAAYLDLCPEDIDGQSRGDTPDLGADELLLR